MHDEISEWQHGIHTGDTPALKKLYDHFSPSLFHLALAIIHTREMAEEVVADVFIQVWQKRKHLDQVQNLKWYLYATTRNIALNYLRKYGPHKTSQLDDTILPAPPAGNTPEDLLIGHEAMQQIYIAINELPPQCRLIFKLVKEDGLKYREVATLLDISIKTVENQVGIALKKLLRIKAQHISNPF